MTAEEKKKKTTNHKKNDTQKICSYQRFKNIIYE